MPEPLVGGVNSSCFGFTYFKTVGSSKSIYSALSQVSITIATYVFFTQKPPSNNNGRSKGALIDEAVATVGESVEIM